MSIDRECLCAMFLSAASEMSGARDLLSDVDSKFGDGDHGVTVGKIARVIEHEVAVWRADAGVPIHDFLEKLGDAIMVVGGGSAGSLYGTLVGGLAEPLSDEGEIDARTLKAMLHGALDAMRDITKARVGDKTMMDALIPAVEAAQCAPDEVGGILTVAASAASTGADRTAQMVSKFGRARSYGEGTIGTKDCGAMSTALFFRGLSAGFGEHRTV